MIILLQFLFAVLALISIQGGLRGLYVGAPAQPEPASIRHANDNIFRFMAGIQLGVGIICLWMCITMEQQTTLVYLMALTLVLAGTGRAISIFSSGISNKKYLGYTTAELVLPIIIAIVQYCRD